MRSLWYTVLVFTCLALGTWVAVYLWQDTVKDSDTWGTEILMRNLNWGTNLERYTPYKTDDLLEFIFITEVQPNQLADIDVSQLIGKLQITEFLVNDQVTPVDRLQNIRSDGALKVTVRGKARTPGITKESLPSLIQVRLTKNSEEVEVIKPTEVKNYTTPFIETTSPETLSSNIDQVLPLSGKNLDAIDRVVVGEKAFFGKLHEGKLYFSIPKNTFGNGEYFVGLFLKNGELIPTNIKLSFTYNSNPINIAAITPNAIKNNQDRFVVVQGNGFKKMISIQLSNNLIFKNALFTIVNDQVVSIKIPKWLDPGQYYFNIMDTAGIYEAKNIPFSVTP